jgi:hypothetical protein
MKEFLKKINWKAFIKEIIIIFAFFSLSYWAGNNKFPHNIWIVPVGTIVIGLAILGHAYIGDKIYNKKDKENGENNE